MTIRELNKSDLLQLAILYKQFWNEDSDIAKMKEKFDQIKSK